MNTDFRLSTTVLIHPKIVKLRRRLGDGGIVNWISLLAHVATSKSNGVLAGMTHEDIAIAATYPGDPDEFVAVLLDLRLLDRDKEHDCFSIHNWEEHNPWAADATRRSEVARNAAQKRWEKTRTEKSSEPLTNKNDAPSTKPDAPSTENHVSSNAPFLSYPFLSHPRSIRKFTGG